MKKKRGLFLLTLPPALMLVTLFSCRTSPKEEFAARCTQQGLIAQDVETRATRTCADFTEEKPKVDFLFLWDNSTSQNFVNDQTKRALKNTLNQISPRFDYHLVLAPLLPDPNHGRNKHLFIVAPDPVGLDSSARGKLVDLQEAFEKLDNFPQVGGTLEEGPERVVDLLTHNQGNGIFRRGAYHIVVLMSNGNYNPRDGLRRGNRQGKLDARKGELIGLRDALQSQMFRLISLVGYRTCTNNNIRIDRAGTFYRDLSKAIYEEPYSSSSGLTQPTDQGNARYPDSIDICTTSNFEHIFDGVNNAVQGRIIGHRYDFWTITRNEDADIDFLNLIVRKEPAGRELRQGDRDNGFVYKGHVTREKRFEPTRGESDTGHLIKLFGTGRVSYPECLVITTQTTTDTYNHIPLGSIRPFESSIEVIINGESVPKDSSNGWQLLKDSDGDPRFISDLNIKNGGRPADRKTGYFLILRGDAIYSNNDRVKATFCPSSS